MIIKDISIFKNITFDNPLWMTYGLCTIIHITVPVCYPVLCFLRTLLSKASDDASQRGFVITISQDTFTFDYQPSTSMDGKYASFDVSVNLSPNYYHHIAVTVYQEDFALYINGSVINATGLDGSINDAVQPVRVGALPQGEFPQHMPASCKYYG